MKMRLVILLAGSLLLLVIAWAHLWRLSDTPKGLYVDETSVGLNAATIAINGHDEHGEAWPTFFKAFGEYKNPISIYATALLFHMFGPSVFGLRFISALFFFLFLIGITLLSWKLFYQVFPVLFIVISAAFLPWFFPVSRIAFEVISQITIVIFSLFCIFEAYHGLYSTKTKLLYSFAGGSLTALSIYSYSTSKLLAFMTLALLIVVYTRKRTALLTLSAIVGFALFIAPYYAFSISHPGALTARFYSITYINNSALALHDKIYVFLHTYSYHFGINFLLLHGDTNFRQGTGYGGVLFVTVFIASIIGFITAFSNKKLHNKRYLVFLALLGLCTPIPAALTLLTAGIATRTLILGLIFLIFAGYGMQFLYKHHKAITWILCITLLAEIGAYVMNYFTIYANNTIPAFETYGLEQSLTIALQHQPEKIIVSPNTHASATNLAFHKLTIANPAAIPIFIAQPRPEQYSCVIFFLPDDLASISRSSLSFLDLTPKNSIPHLRCYL